MSRGLCRKSAKSYKKSLQRTNHRAWYICRQISMGSDESKKEKKGACLIHNGTLQMEFSVKNDWRNLKLFRTKKSTILSLLWIWQKTKGYHCKSGIQRFEFRVTLNYVNIQQHIFILPYVDFITFFNRFKKILKSNQKSNY